MPALALLTVHHSPVCARGLEKWVQSLDGPINPTNKTQTTLVTIPSANIFDRCHNHWCLDWLGMLAVPRIKRQRPNGAKKMEDPLSMTPRTVRLLEAINNNQLRADGFLALAKLTTSR